MQNHEIKNRIENGIQGAECFVNEFSGGNDHYAVIVVSNEFEGKNLLARHRLIMDLFRVEVDSGEVHALTIKAFTQEQWALQRNQYVK